jgi:DNA-binding sugar fermentation-stimulating protein
VVERIEGNEVRFVYSLGPGIRLSQNGGFQRVVGHIDDKGALRGKLRSGAEVVYRWSGGDKLLTEYSREGLSARATPVRR